MLSELSIATRARYDFQDVTSRVQQVVAEHGTERGICTLFVPHTTAGLTLNENWDPDVRGDLLRALEALVPSVPYQHGEGNSPAHLLSTLAGASETLLIDAGRIVLGTWQGIYLVEFDGPRRRRLLLKIVSDADS